MSDYLKQRRTKLAKLMGNGAFLMFNRQSVLRNGDSKFPFRSASHFLYLTDLSLENTALLLLGGSEPKFYLFTAPNSEHQSLWEGDLPSFEELKAQYQFDDVFDIHKMDEILPKLVQNESTFWVDLDSDPKAMEIVKKITHQRQISVRRGTSPLESIKDINLPLSELRLIKDEEESERMKQAAFITKQAHLEAMKACQPGMNEREIQAIIEFIFRKNGGSYPAYNSIVGSGINACTLHYTDNIDPLKDGDLVLIDAGVEYQGYAADVTRTFPVNGTFTQPQRKIYEIVLEAQTQAIEAAIVGNTFRDVHNAAALALAKGLVSLGFLKGDPAELILDQEFKKYYPHNTSHWLGIDVHDVGLYQHKGKSKELVAGIALTIEPGLYFSPSFEEIPKEYHGIGIRIEDDVLVTSEGPLVLTQGIPKTVEEIESTMKLDSFYAQLS